MVSLDRVRARTIVSLAAKKVKDRNTRNWLLVDREGTWEKTAGEYLEEARLRAREAIKPLDEDDAAHFTTYKMAIEDVIALLKGGRA